jgi:hypothetical protein
MGMSLGGNNVGTFTLITGRDRPSSLNATGESCQSNSKTEEGGALICSEQVFDFEGTCLHESQY